MNLKKGLAVNLFLIVLTVGNAVRADWSPANERSSSERAKGGHLEKLSQELNLTKDQEQKLKSIYESRDQRLQTLYSEFRSKRTALQDETDGKIEALLTAEQREKLKKIQEKRLVERTKALRGRN